MSNIQEDQHVYVKINNEIATVYINRPEKRNAINSSMWKELIRIVDECSTDPDIRVLIFRSTTPEAFSAGADMGEFATLRDTPERAKNYNGLLLTLEDKIANSPKPSIAMIQGYCVGGGCEMAVACDFRFSDNTGMFGITPAKLGIVYPTRSTKYLTDLIGPSNAKDILLTGRLFNADEAFQMGLINRIVESDKLETQTYAYAEMIAKNSELSVKASKYIIQEIADGAVTDSEAAKQFIEESIYSEDYRNRVRAFLNKKNAD